MLENGTLVDGKYEILSKVGQGGMSVVYLAINRKAMKQWAIKEVRRDGVKDFNVVKQSLVAETDMLKKLSHPNLPDIVDIIDNEDSFLIVMDYIEGKPLSKRIEESGAQPEAYVVEWAKQLCDVLDYLHTRQPAIIYRDMKPSNVMLKPDGSVCLIDFGTAREYKGTNIQDTTCLGTIGYAAPEQFGGQGETDARTDIYCLGATLYHLVTGHSPAEPPYEMHPIRYWDPSLSPGLEAIILKCIQKDPNDRYQSCAELKYALEHMEEEVYEYFVQQTKRRNLFLTSIIATLLCLVIGLTGTILSHTTTADEYRRLIEGGNYSEAFELGYTGDSPEELKNNFVNYINELAADNVITNDELNEFKNSLSEQYENAIKRDKNVYCDFCYQIGIYCLQYYSSTGDVDLPGSADKADFWFKKLKDMTGLNEAAQREQRMAAIYVTIAEYYTDASIGNSELESNNTAFLDTFNALSEACTAVQSETNEVLKYRVYAAFMFFITGTKNQQSVYDKCISEGVKSSDIATILSLIESEVNAGNSGDVKVQQYAAQIQDLMALVPSLEGNTD